LDYSPTIVKDFAFFAALTSGKQCALKRGRSRRLKGREMTVNRCKPFHHSGVNSGSTSGRQVTVNRRRRIARGDPSGQSRRSSSRCFNPRRALARAATLSAALRACVESVSIRAARTCARRLRPCQLTEPQGLCNPIPQTCQSFTHLRTLNCQRTRESVRHHCGCVTARNPGHGAVTGGSRKPGHKISGSLRSSGLFTP
jgi:hypothetical protein